MSDMSAILSLPYIQPSQAQKHVTHNEALKILDVLVQPRMHGFDTTTPPSAPNEGDAYALGIGATGLWAGKDGQLAVWLDGVWAFFTPMDGWQSLDLASGELRVYSAGVWGPAKVGMDDLEGVGVNATADVTNRLSVASPATLFNNEGQGHQIKVNKAASADTASLMFQTNWTGHAEMGLTGSDDFAIKVSADGTTWATGLVIEAATGRIGLGGVAPAQTLHIGDVMRLEPTTPPAVPAAGDIYYDSAMGKLRCHDGVIWNNLF